AAPLKGCPVYLPTIMELLLSRKAKNDKATIAKLSVDGLFECYTLEDKDRGLRKDMPLDRIKKIKVHGQTAIPIGRYRVKLTYSNRFKRILPEIENVPGYLGIRIHSGNKSSHTEGCPLTGAWNGKDADWISDSRKAFDKLFVQLESADKRKEEIWITIESGYGDSIQETIAMNQVLVSATNFLEARPDSLMA
ncbi:DUF5675 family protein, partial [Siphonobacter sp. BAB-5385]|uniref:DUF5675 family protein n=1 Tax=Siphonobacter sp. BAB-5385 TaxID=1864822 RepID=UPI001C3D9131